MGRSNRKCQVLVQASASSSRWAERLHFDSFLSVSVGGHGPVGGELIAGLWVKAETEGHLSFGLLHCCQLHSPVEQQREPRHQHWLTSHLEHALGWNMNMTNLQLYSHTPCQQTVLGTCFSHLGLLNLVSVIAPEPCQKNLFKVDLHLVPWL